MKFGQISVISTNNEMFHWIQYLYLTKSRIINNVYMRQVNTVSKRKTKELKKSSKK